MNAIAFDWGARCSTPQHQFVRLVNYMPKPTVFWHLADDPTLDRDGIEAQPPLPAGHVELIDVAEVLLQSPPYTRSYTRTGEEP